MADTLTRKGLIWTLAALGVVLIGGMLILKVWFAKTVFMPIDEEAVVIEPLDPDEQLVRDMVTSTVPGTAVMPTAEFTLDPSDYSRDLSQWISIETGMDRYLATDELLLYYNSDPESGAKVSSSERNVDGATLFVIRRSGLQDDSLAAEETFALFDDDVLVDFGTRIQCYRGPNPNQWTTELCP